VGWKIAEAYRKKNTGIPAVVLATAHPGKFMEIVEQATGKTPALPEALSSLMNRKKEAVFLGRTDADLSGWLRGRFS
jgi:threonine synthase